MMRGRWAVSFNTYLQAGNIMVLLKRVLVSFPNLSHISDLVEGMKKSFFQVERGVTKLQHEKFVLWTCSGTEK
jgi:hypothetical protein